MSEPGYAAVDLLANGAPIGDISEAILNEARQHSDSHPWVYTNMIQSADGATAVDGLSGQLGGPADLATLIALRACADVILVGSSTAVGEGYRPPDPSPAVRATRRARGQRERPLVAVVTSSLSMPSHAPLFQDPTYRPLIVTTEAAPQHERTRLAEHADITSAGVERVDPRAAIDVLAAAGHSRILLEGGPSLNGQFIAEGLIDEWNMTLAPLLVSGNSKRLAVGPDGSPQAMRLVRLWLADGLLLCRYLRD